MEWQYVSWDTTNYKCEKLCGQVERRVAGPGPKPVGARTRTNLPEENAQVALCAVLLDTGKGGPNEERAKRSGKRLCPTTCPSLPLLHFAQEPLWYARCLTMVRGCGCYGKACNCGLGAAARRAHEDLVRKHKRVLKAAERRLFHHEKEDQFRP